MKYLFPLSPYNQQRQFEKPVWVYPAHLAMYATHLKNNGHEVAWGTNYWGDRIGIYDKVIKDDTQIDVPFVDLPFPDRVFTEAKHKIWQAYGNYKFHPATHMMSSNLCWYGKCTFCIDTEKLKSEKRGVRPVGHVIEEIDDLIAHGYREVFDDSGTFPIGKWLEEFCREMRKKGRNKKIKIGCNLRVQELDWKMLKSSGFRFLLFGVESANQGTLDRIKKSAQADQTIPVLKSASDAGLEPHATFMTGYPWEDEKDELRTIKLCHYLLRKGFAKTAQASVYSPPRTKPEADSKGHRYLPRFYDVYRDPRFLVRTVFGIKGWADVKYLIRGAKLVFEEKIRKKGEDILNFNKISHRSLAEEVLKKIEYKRSQYLKFDKKIADTSMCHLDEDIPIIKLSQKELILLSEFILTDTRYENYIEGTTDVIRWNKKTNYNLLNNLICGELTKIYFRGVYLEKTNWNRK